MRQLERLVVHVEEAMRLAAQPGNAYKRISLLLFDSAAELMLHRESDYRLKWDRMLLGRQLEMLEQHEARIGSLPSELAERKRDLQGRVISRRRREKIEREFGAKVALLEESGLIATETLRVLRKLHQYRNEAYHRDEIRPATLATAVEIYGYVVLVMMRDLPVHVMSWGGDTPGPVAKYVEKPSLGLDVQALIANALLERYSLDPQGGVRTALSEHLVDRLDDFDEVLSDSAGFFAELRDDPSWDSDAVLKLIQFDAAEDPFMTVAEIREKRVPIERRHLNAWRSRAAAIAHQPELLKAFGRFADIEDEFENLEEAAFALSRSIDQHVNMEIDRMRGK